MSEHLSEYTCFLAPAKSLRVVDPATSRALPERGAHVQGNKSYWLRRLRDGDVIEVPPKKSEVKPT